MDLLYQGYMCHIIMDAVWYKRVADKYIRIYPPEIRQKYYDKAYRDYWKLNAILRREYALEEPRLNITEIGIEEIHHSFIEKVFLGLEEHYHILEDYAPHDLTLIPYRAIQDYIEESVDLCMKELASIGEKNNNFKPEDLYVIK